MNIFIFLSQVRYCRLHWFLHLSFSLSVSCTVLYLGCGPSLRSSTVPMSVLFLAMPGAMSHCWICQVLLFLHRALLKLQLNPIEKVVFEQRL